jgi:hypothetical protein
MMICGGTLNSDGSVLANEAVMLMVGAAGKVTVPVNPDVPSTTEVGTVSRKAGKVQDG